MRRYLATFYRHWWLYVPILIVMLTGTAFGTHALVQKAAKYQSTTRIWVSQPLLQDALGQSNSLQQITPAQERNDMLYQLIQTDSFIQNVVKGTPIESQLTGVIDHDEPLLTLVRTGIRIQVLGANSVLISYQDKSPELAQTILQNIVSNLRSWLLDTNSEQASAVKTYYEKQAGTYQQQLNQASQALDTFTTQHPNIKPDDITSQAQLQRLQLELQSAQQAYNVAESKLQEYEVISNLSASSNDESTFRTLDEPTTPGEPASALKKAVKYAGAGVAATVSFLVGVIVLFTWTDKSVWTSEELSTVGQIPVLAVIPRLRRSKQRKTQPVGPQDSVATNKPVPTTGMG